MPKHKKAKGSYPLPWEDDNVVDFTEHYHGNGKSQKVKPACRESHPVVELGGGKIHGGSCFHPPEDCDVYVGFDRGMSRVEHYPWEQPTDSPIYICYPIVDGCAPPNPARFKKMIEWLAAQLAEGKEIAMGCLGGHGRTGTVLSALVAHVTKNPDAIKWVRDNYCKKAVESKDQVDFLVKHYGLTPYRGSKETDKAPKDHWSGGNVTFTPNLPVVGPRGVGELQVRPDPRMTSLMIWGQNVRLTNA